MTLETFFENFDQFADAPDAVAKMRELVRNFAVTGKLVVQDPNDEPAEALVARIATALPDKKSENPFLGEIETSITDESEYEFPSGWAWLPLGHVGIWATGCGFPMQYQGETDGEFLFCKVSDMNLPGNEVEIHRTVHSIDADVMKKIRARANPVGTVIFPKIGGAIATHKRRLVIKPTIIDNNCSGIQPIGLTDDRWLLLFMRSLDLTKYQSGTSVPAVSQGSLDPIRIGLPPLAEQKRIVAKVDELMALCDRLEAQQQERETWHAALARASLARFADAPTPANLDYLFHSSFIIPPSSLRKSILTLAVQGKLVPQDPNDEPVEDSLARNDERRRETAASDHRADEENQPLLSGDDRWDIAETWAWRGLADLVLFVDYRGKTPAKLSSGVRLLTAKNVRKGQINLSPEEFLSESEYHAWMTRGFPKAGDVLFTTEAPMGNAAVIELTERFALAQRVICFQSYGALDPAFLVLQILSDQFQFILDKNGTGVTAKGIKASKLKQLPIAIPPLAEQRRIVAKVEQLMALVDGLETQLAASRATAANLLSALAAELTHQ